jgi:hypothetical protein
LPSLPSSTGGTPLPSSSSPGGSDANTASSTSVSASPPPPHPGSRVDKHDDTADPPKLRDALILFSPHHAAALERLDSCHYHGHAPVLAHPSAKLG